MNNPAVAALPFDEGNDVHKGFAYSQFNSNEPSLQSPPCVPPNGTILRQLNGFPTPDVNFLENQIGARLSRRKGDQEPQVRSSKRRRVGEEGVVKKYQRADNMAKKGAMTVIGHHVMGFRFGRNTETRELMLVFLIISSYGSKLYFTALQLSDACSLSQHCCTCFAGESICIHKTAALFLIARYKKVNIPDFQGARGVVLSVDSKLELLLRREAQSKLDMVNLLKYYESRDVAVKVHPEKLAETTWAEMKAHLDLLHFYGRKKRGQPSLGDTLEGLSYQKYHAIAIESGIDMVAHGIQNKKSKSKEEWRKLILQNHIDSGSDMAGEAKYQVEVLDVCPCLDHSEDLLIRCPKCRQWWHSSCAGQTQSTSKHFKKCKICSEKGSLIKKKKFEMAPSDSFPMCEKSICGTKKCIRSALSALNFSLDEIHHFCRPALTKRARPQLFLSATMDFTKVFLSRLSLINIAEV